MSHFWFKEASIMVITRTAQSRRKAVLCYIYNTAPCVPSFYHRAVNLAYPSLQVKVSQKRY